LLLAKRLLKQLGMDKYYQGATKTDGEDYNVGVNPNPDRRPFMAVLDVGLVRTKNGNRVFGVMKGACDGGLYVPHSTKRFPGADDEEQYDATKHRERIFGVHVDAYMKQLKEESTEDYLK
jgi:large subunit ribosomal protein L5e